MFYGWGMLFENRIALVTGSSSDIGAAIANYQQISELCIIFFENNWLNVFYRNHLGKIESITFPIPIGSPFKFKK